MATILFDKIVYGPVHVCIMNIIGRVRHCRNGKK